MSHSTWFLSLDINKVVGLHVTDPFTDCCKSHKRQKFPKDLKNYKKTYVNVGQMCFK